MSKEPLFSATDDGQLIFDDDMSHDVLLRVEGDFASDDERIAYAAKLVEALNRCADSVTPPAPDFRTLTEEQIERHQVLAGACPPGSEVMLASSIRRLLGMDAVPDSDSTAPSVVEPAPHSDQWWLHRIDMEKTQAWQQGYSQGLNRAHPPRAPLSVDAAVKTLVDALIESKGWMRSYADALIRSAIDRDKEPPQAPLTDAEIDLVWDTWFGVRWLQATPAQARREFARAVLAASGADPTPLTEIELPIAPRNESVRDEDCWRNGWLCGYEAAVLAASGGGE